MEAVELLVTTNDEARLSSEEFVRVERELREHLRLLEGGNGKYPRPPRLLFGDGQQIELSPSVLQAFQFVVHHMAQGDAIGLVPGDKEVSTIEAAKILNVSRPHLVKLLNEARLPFSMTGSHRRLRMRDVIEYKQRRDRESLDMLDALAREAEAAGDYFEE